MKSIDYGVKHDDVTVTEPTPERDYVTWPGQLIQYEDVVLPI